jgi:polyhydroxybutyrate depolymerase
MRRERFCPMSHISQIISRFAQSLALVCAIAFAGSGNAAAQSISIVAPDGKRTAVYVRGADVAPTPLVVVLHGAFGTADQVRRMTSWERVARQGGFAVVFPDGIKRRWNDARRAAARKLNPSTADDLGFLRKLVVRLIQDGVADPARIYITGLSNGGHMTHRLICEAGELFAASAPVIANLAQTLEVACPSAPSPVMLINGTADTLTPYDGESSSADPKAAILSAPATFAFFAKRNGCHGAPTETAIPASGRSVGTSVTRVSGAQCKHETQLLRINGGGHTTPEFERRGGGLIANRLFGAQNQDIDMAEEIWAFFKGKHRQSVTGSRTDIDN